MKNKLIILLFGLYVSFLNSHAQNFWKPTNGPTGGCIKGVVKDSLNNIYTITTSGIFKSVNNGLNWININNNLPDSNISAIIVDDSNHIIIGSTKGNVFKSNNQGNSWSLMYALGYWIQNFYICSDHKMLIGYNAGIAVYTPYSGIWHVPSYNNISGATSVCDFAEDQAGNIYAMERNSTRIFYSFDNAMTFYGKDIENICVPNLYMEDVNHITIDNFNRLIISTSIGMYVSADTLNTITRMNNILQQKSVDEVCINGSNWTTFASNPDYLKIHYYSTNSGNTWTGIDTINELYFTVHCFMNEISYCDYNGHIWYSDNYGQSWNCYYIPIHMTGINTLTLDNNDRIYAAMFSSGISCTDDHGNTWKDIRYNLDCRDLIKVAVNHNNQVFVTTAAAIGFGGLYKLVDTTWIKIRNFNHPDVPGIFFNSEDTIIYTEGDQILKSSDNGQNWDSINLSLDIFYIDSLDNIYAKDKHGPKGIYRSSDNGASWAFIDSSMFYYGSDIVVSGNGTFYMQPRYSTGLPNGIYKSVNQGQSWIYCGRPVNTNYSESFIGRFFPVSTGEIIAHVYSKIPTPVYYDYTCELYLNNGQDTNWILNSTGFDFDLDNTSHYVTSYIEDNACYVYVGTTTNGVYRSVNPFGNSGIHESGNTDNKILITPNPFNDFITIHLKRPEKTSIYLYDMNSRLLKNLTDTNHFFTIKTGELQAGFYLIVVSTKQHKYVNKLIKI